MQHIARSVAAQLTAVVPIAKREPDAGEHVTVSLVPSTASLTAGVKVTIAPVDAVAIAVMSACVILGAVVSTTFTVNVLVVVPAVLVALQLTVVVPSGNVEPDGGVQPTATEPLVSDALAA